MLTRQPSSDSPSAGDRVRVFIADEQPLFRYGVRLTFDEATGVDVVGEAGSGRDALALLETVSPDICLVDASLPAGGLGLGFGDPAAPGGIELGRLIKDRLPHTAVVIIASFEEEEQLFHAMKVGASAYCLRDITPEALIDLVHRVKRGEYLMSDSVLARSQVRERVLKQFRALAAGSADAEPVFVPLSTREVEILDYIARGQSNKSIARSLNISDQTVKNHITSILRKLSVSDRTQAVIYALRHNWIKL